MTQVNNQQKDPSVVAAEAFVEVFFELPIIRQINELFMRLSLTFLYYTRSEAAFVSILQGLKPQSEDGARLATLKVRLIREYQPHDTASLINHVVIQELTNLRHRSSRFI